MIAGFRVGGEIEGNLVGMGSAGMGREMVFGLGFAITLSNISDNSCRAVNYNGVLLKYDLGDGCFRTGLSMMAALMAASVDDVTGICDLYGKINFS